MTAREAILERHPASAWDAPQTRRRPLRPCSLRIPEVTRGRRRIESMLERVAALAGTPYPGPIAAREAIDYVEGVIPWPHVGRLERALPAGAGLRLRHHRYNAELRHACATANVGITSADYALADTGSLVMIASPEDARLISLLPPVHIAIVPAACLLTGLDELYTLIPRPADRTSSMVFITGPSRTADIEQILVRGVHGPGEIHVVIVE
jgi:hypothetical protein